MSLVTQQFFPPANTRGAIKAISLPLGYRMEWGGEHESAGEAQASLGKQMPIALGTMFLITVLLFGKLRPTAVIWTVGPMAVNGVALGLLFTGLPFRFTAPRLQNATLVQRAEARHR